jgi:hypothetical protein
LVSISSTFVSGASALRGFKIFVGDIHGPLKWRVRVRVVFEISDIFFNFSSTYAAIFLTRSSFITADVVFPATNLYPHEAFHPFAIPAGGE